MMFSPTELTILNELKKVDWIERKELAKRLGMPRTTVYDNLKRLLDRGFVVKAARNNGKRGRSIVYWGVLEK